MSSVLRVLAPNPSPMTLEGTNTYVVVAGDDALVVDPGPADAGHLDAIDAAAAAHGARVTAIAVTHGHPDHYPGAAPLRDRTGAPVYAHALARFPHDRAIGEGDTVCAGAVTLRVLATPGHARDHVVFALDDEGALFTGDVVVGRGTVVIAPPNGDMREYQATLARLRREAGSLRVLYGGHGDAMHGPAAKLDEYIAHRIAREGEILELLRRDEHTIPELVRAIYAAYPQAIWPAAARQVLAYLIALEREGRVRSRRIERTPDAAEAAILNPDLSAIVDPESAAVARAELGIDRTIDHIDAYCHSSMSR